MTKGDLRINLPRLGAIIGIVVALLTIGAVAVSAGDDRYVKKTDYQADVLQMKGDLRVLRCELVQDCAVAKP